MSQQDSLSVADFVALADDVDPADIPAASRDRLNAALDRLRADDADPVPEPPAFDVVEFDASGSYGSPYQATATVADADGDLDFVAEVALRFEDAGGGLVNFVHTEPESPSQSLTVEADFTDDDIVEEFTRVVLKAREAGQSEFVTLDAVDVSGPVGSPDKFDVTEFDVGYANESFEVSATVEDADGDDDVGFVGAEAQSAAGDYNDFASADPETGQASVSLDASLDGSGVNGDTRKVELQAKDADSPDGAPPHVLDTFDLTSPVGSPDKFEVTEFTATSTGDSSYDVSVTVEDADGDDDVGSVFVSARSTGGDFIDSVAADPSEGQASVSASGSVSGTTFGGDPIAQLLLFVQDQDVQQFPDPPDHTLETKDVS